MLQRKEQSLFTNSIKYSTTFHILVGMSSYNMPWSCCHNCQNTQLHMLVLPLVFQSQFQSEGTLPGRSWSCKLGWVINSVIILHIMCLAEGKHTKYYLGVWGSDGHTHNSSSKMGLVYQWNRQNLKLQHRYTRPGSSITVLTAQPLSCAVAKKW